jgi:SAM-dependent methyltransferase
MSVLERALKYYLKRVRYRSKGWKFSRERRGMFVDEGDEWKKHYLPINVKGLTVLDVGAGEGETARFFLEHGARKVLCIEPDEACFRRLTENARDRPLTCFKKRFSKDDLNLPFDFMKMDIEGFEVELLGAHFGKPCVVEVHGQELRERFAGEGYAIEDNLMHIYTSFAYKNLEKAS